MDTELYTCIYWLVSYSWIYHTVSSWEMCSVLAKLLSYVCMCVCPMSHSSTVHKLPVCTAWTQWICVYCMLSFAWNPQPLLVLTSLSVTGGCTAVGSLHKATSNNRGVWLCEHEGWWLMKWNCCVWADFHKPNSPLLLFLVSLHLSGWRTGVSQSSNRI